MRYELINEYDVAASADDVWAVYSSPDLPKLIVKLLPGVFERIDIVKGDGGLGTVLHLVYPPGSVPLTYKEKFVTIDNCKRLKEVLQIEGGYLEMGVTFYMDSFEIIEKGCDSCIIKSITKYEIKDELADKVSPLISVDSLVAMARAISKYVLGQKKEGRTSGDCEDNPWERGRGGDDCHDSPRGDDCDDSPRGHGNGGDDCNDNPLEHGDGGDDCADKPWERGHGHGHGHGHGDW